MTNSKGDHAVKKSSWVGAGFSLGHMVSVLVEMIFIIFLVGSITNVNNIAFLGGVIGAVAFGTIGAINIYAMKKWGKSGSAILSSKILNKTGVLGPFGSSLVTGLVFGLGFDTATQISAIALSVVVSATAGIQVSLMLVGLFALGMIPVDKINSVVLRSAFSRLFNTNGFSYISHSLSGAAITVASVVSYETLTNTVILPNITGPLLAVSIISISFGYAFVKRKYKVLDKL